jgi:Zn-dependent protease
MPTRQGSFRLFRFAGVDVFLHWSWFLVAAYAMSSRTTAYSSPVWNVLEYLSLFVIVLMHEFGHALACRQVGGQADQIVLWPLGGVAYVDPPQRPGATLWSIAAGPLVNVALLPVLTVLGMVSRSSGWAEAMPNAHNFVWALFYVNCLLLIFNLLPIYPLDGGQILRSLLWFVLGRARSLMVASIVGFMGVAVLIVLALWTRSVWFGILSAFILMNCWGGLMQARALARVAKLPRHEGFACPSCQSAPPRGEFWMCGQCRTRFDTFATGTVCPQCGAQSDVTRCLDCGRSHPMSEWISAAPVPPQL